MPDRDQLGTGGLASRFASTALLTLGGDEAAPLDVLVDLFFPVPQGRNKLNNYMTPSVADGISTTGGWR